MPTPADRDSPAVHTHLNMLQGVISRMGSNSAVCKTLCATLVSTIGAVAYAAKSPEGMWIAIIPILLFCYLDTMYLSLEMGFRKGYNDFVKRLHEGKVDDKELFVIMPPENYRGWKAMSGAVKSWSIKYPYPALLALTFLIMAFVRFTETAI